ncbi:sulfatase-like hydrolase/transferase [Marinilongibacter aquaticus]|uniref:LTA synthase family protein n=1 Tax=Marinilongibacter aquaticus TaxID=2975157 RepID=UPI0021BD340B|nr:alkaline phosphatase family protein [Marinilongibacter aquaticus]UBM59284.1 sulfatase-like hydrolase/transferase [Marinilongibacter aquaticus]
MKERIQFLFIYFGFWVVYFLAARVLFLSYHIDQTKLLSLETLAGVFWHGIRMDMSMAGYLCLLPFLWIAFSNFIKKSIFENTLFSYTLILVFIITLIVVVDLEVYSVWDYRLDATPLNYLKTPKEAFVSVQSSPVVRLLISYILLIIVAGFIVYRIIAKHLSTWKHINNWPFPLIVFILAISLIIPIRGGFGIAPMNQSTVYFSNSNFANISAVNASWNFFDSLVNQSYEKVNPYTYLPKEDIDKAMKTLYANDSPEKNILVSSPSKPNVLVIIWESFTKKVVDLKHKGLEVTPFFNKLKNEGIFFTNAYASGDRTDKGIVAVLSGYPAQPTHSIIKIPEKAHKLPILSKDFNAQGYRTEFYYGGETEFANIKSYLLTADFQRIVDMNDFPEEMQTTKWGVHDQETFQKFIDDHSRENKGKFFSTLLTLSSHEPFDVPLDTARFEGQDELDLFMNSLYYTDRSLEQFITQAKQQYWWNNTVVVILGDHGHRLPETGKKEDNFRIPILFTGGAVKSRSKINDVVSQIDVSKSLLKQLNFNDKNYIWSKSLFKEENSNWAYFAFNNGFGFVEPNKTLVFDNIGKKYIDTLGTIGNKELRLGKALQQKTFQDFVDK